MYSFFADKFVFVDCNWFFDHAFLLNFHVVFVLLHIESWFCVCVTKVTFHVSKKLKYKQNACTHILLLPISKNYDQMDRYDVYKVSLLLLKNSVSEKYEHKQNACTHLL